MQGDAYWALAMAINVYLTFYHKYDARMLRKMEITYLLCCYGIPFIPGLTFIFVSNQQMGRPYGDAVLWCWLKSEWEIYRIATFYGPIWYGHAHIPLSGHGLTNTGLPSLPL
jgi:ABC-type arginine/histidine transport system permease subunit